jgi:hypothetical protein
MKKIPMLERFAAQSLVEYEGELIFSKEKFAELIVRECVGIVERYGTPDAFRIVDEINRVMLNIRPNKHFGVEE